MAIPSVAPQTRGLRHAGKVSDPHRRPRPHGPGPRAGGIRLNFKTIALIVAVFATLPFAAASNQVSTDGGNIEGRALLFDLTKFDPDLAAVAGKASAQVNWLGGVISFEKSDAGFVYASPAGTGDPATQRLIPTGTWYNFTDDNGATWQVAEWYYLKTRHVQYQLGNERTTESEGYRIHVWSVATSAEVHRDALVGLDYNFVVVVDVGKLGYTPLDQEGRPDGPAFHPDPKQSGEIDLHFSSTDPMSRCVTC